MSKFSLGIGRGNWGGRGVGERKCHDTTFDFLVGLLCDNPEPRWYTPTTRGLQSVLGLDGDTFSRYRKGQTRPPSVIIAHMEALLYFEHLKIPGERFWNYVEKFHIKPTFGKIEESEKLEQLFEVDFEGTTFRVRQFATGCNRKFQEIIFQPTGIITAPVKAEQWKCIVAQAMDGGYRGPNADDYSNRQKALADKRARQDDLFYRYELT